MIERVFAELPGCSPLLATALKAAHIGTLKNKNTAECALRTTSVAQGTI